MKLSENKKTLPTGLLVTIAIFILLCVTLFGSDNKKNETANKNEQKAQTVEDDGTFKIIASQENKALEEVIRNYIR